MLIAVCVNQGGREGSARKALQTNAKNVNPPFARNERIQMNDISNKYNFAHYALFQQEVQEVEALGEEGK